MKKREKKKIKSRPDFAEITIHDSPELLLRAFWEKKIESAYIERNWNFGGGYIVNF